MLRRRAASAEGVGALLAGDGPRSGPKPHASVCLTNPGRRFYCRFPADRQQTERRPAGLLRAAPRIKSTAPRIKALRTKSIAAYVAPPCRFCRRRRSLACRRWVAQRPQTRCLGTPDESGAQVLLPVPGRSSASWTPTGCAQNQKHCAWNQKPCAQNQHCGLNRLRRMSRSRSASAEGVGALLAGDGPRSGPKPDGSVHLTNLVRSFYCRFPADRQQAGLLRAAPRIRSLAPRIKSTAPGIKRHKSSLSNYQSGRELARDEAASSGWRAPNPIASKLPPTGLRLVKRGLFLIRAT